MGAPAPGRGPSAAPCADHCTDSRYVVAKADWPYRGTSGRASLFVNVVQEVHLPVPFRRLLTYPLRLTPAEDNWASTPFGKLAAINNLSAVGDALVVVALAGSVFVSVPLHAARGRTALGLVCTMLPFAVVAPLTGPFTDRVRRGKGFVVLLSAMGRLAAVVMMGLWVHNLLLFPAAFLALVCSKTHAVARAALIPALVPDDSQLVSANSKMALGGNVSSAIAAGVGGAVYAIGGGKAVLDLDIFVFALLTVAAVELIGPKTLARAARPAPGSGSLPSDIGRMALAVGGIRAMAGFMTALVVFAFRSQGAPLVWYGLVAIGGVAGSLAGAVLAPAARARVHSNRLLVASSCFVIGATAGVVSQLHDAHHRLGAFALALLAGMAGSIAKAAFDTAVQQRVPEVARAKTIGRLEASFQTVWVLAALVPTLLPFPLALGFGGMAVLLIVVGFNLVHPLTAPSRRAERRS